MLKITKTAGADEHRWVLCGQLTGPWVEELRAQWLVGASEPGAQKRIVDLSEVTFIDESGEGLLASMRRDGAEFVAKGIDTKHILENLNATDNRALRRCLSHLSTRGARRARAIESPDE